MNTLWIPGLALSSLALALNRFGVTTLDQLHLIWIVTLTTVVPLMFEVGVRNRGPLLNRVVLGASLAGGLGILASWPVLFYGGLAGLFLAALLSVTRTYKPVGGFAMVLMAIGLALMSIFSQDGPVMGISPVHGKVFASLILLLFAPLAGLCARGTDRMPGTLTITLLCATLAGWSVGAALGEERVLSIAWALVGLVMLAFPTRLLRTKSEDEVAGVMVAVASLAAFIGASLVLVTAAQPGGPEMALFSRGPVLVGPALLGLLSVSVDQTAEQPAFRRSDWPRAATAAA